MIPIAIYHWNIGIVSRGKGKSAVAAAAYRSGEKLTNEWDGMTHDYTRKGGVVHTEIMLPPHAPPKGSEILAEYSYNNFIKPNVEKGRLIDDTQKDS